MKNLTTAIVIFCFSILAYSTQVAANKETFFGCESGFQYESKKNAARCIKQQKQTFRPPLKCQHKRMGMAKLRLVVDSDGIRDRCELVRSPPGLASNKSANHRGKRLELQFPPRCMTGYKLQARKGKDACAKGNVEQIKPPTKKVTR
jgi:hypothetical protein